MPESGFQFPGTHQLLNKNCATVSLKLSAISAGFFVVVVCLDNWWFVRVTSNMGEIGFRISSKV